MILTTNCDREKCMYIDEVVGWAMRVPCYNSDFNTDFNWGNKQPEAIKR